MRVDLDKLLRRAKAADDLDPCCWYDRDTLDTESVTDDLFISSASPRVVTALIERIRELETLGTAALTRLATATVSLQAEGVLTHDEAAAEVAWIRERHAIIAKGTCTP